jgi:hypothetical protein
VGVSTLVDDVRDDDVRRRLRIIGLVRSSELPGRLRAEDGARRIRGGESPNRNSSKFPEESRSTGLLAIPTLDFVAEGRI